MLNYAIISIEQIHYEESVRKTTLLGSIHMILHVLNVRATRMGGSSS